MAIRKGIKKVGQQERDYMNSNRLTKKIGEIAADMGRHHTTVRNYFNRNNLSYMLDNGRIYSFQGSLSEYYDKDFVPRENISKGEMNIIHQKISKLILNK